MIRYVSTAVVLLSLVGCSLLTGPDKNDGTCRVYSPLPTYGCARLVVLLGPLPANSPSSYRWMISAEGEGITGGVYGKWTWPEEVQFSLNLGLPLTAGSTTATVTIVADVRDDTGPTEVGVRLPLVAVDSVRHTVRFAAVGERAPVDTVRLNVRAASGR